MKKLLEVLELGTEFLIKHRIEDARLNMQLILCSVLNLQKIELYTQFDKPLNDQELSLVREYMTERAKGKPLQYVLNSAQFFDFQLELNNSVLIPRPETEELIFKVFSENMNTEDELNILDIGTGSGCIAIALAKNYPQAKVFAIDIDEKAIEIARKNSERNSVENIQFHKLNILGAIPKTKFDIIVSNPPYIPQDEYLELDDTVRKFEPKVALTDEGDGLEFYRRFASIFQKMLNPGGKFYLEFGFGQKNKIIDIFGVTKYQINVSMDTAGIDRIISGYCIA